MNLQRIIDSHVHFSAAGRYADFLQYLEEMEFAAAGIVSLPDRLRVNYNPEALHAKLDSPERFFVFGGFDYTRWFYPEIAVQDDTLAAQAERMAAIGMDGIKMWAGKPTFQSQLGFGLDDPVYSAAFEAAAHHALPIVLHVADPPQFWSSDLQRFGWTAADDAAPPPSFERLQAQAETVLRRHRNTTFIFPHLLFRTADLDAFSRFMDANENACLDLSPGLYFYGDLHRQRRRARRFFETFRERVLFGTDAMWFDEGHPYLPALSVDQNIRGARRLLDFLETAKTVENPFAPTHEELPTLEGLELPSEILEPILSGNFSRLLGDRPRPVDGETVRSYAAEIEFRRREISDREGAT